MSVQYARTQTSRVRAACNETRKQCAASSQRTRFILYGSTIYKCSERGTLQPANVLDTRTSACDKCKARVIAHSVGHGSAAQYANERSGRSGRSGRSKLLRFQNMITCDICSPSRDTRDTSTSPTSNHPRRAIHGSSPVLGSLAKLNTSKEGPIFTPKGIADRGMWMS